MEKKDRGRKEIRARESKEEEEEAKVAKSLFDNHQSNGNSAESPKISARWLAGCLLVARRDRERERSNG